MQTIPPVVSPQVLAPPKIEAPIVDTADLPIFYTSTLPRSGSTLLQNILGQNPKHHVTPTNDLIELIVGVRNHWLNCEAFKAQGLSAIKPRIENTLKSMLVGFYMDELDHGKVIFDKSRGWLAYIDLLEEVLKRKVKMLVTVRDIRSILASFEKVHRQSSLTKHPVAPPAYFDMQTIEGRARQFLSPGAVVGIAINRLRDAIARGYSDRLLIIPYKLLCKHPQHTLDHIHKNLGLEPYKYDFDDVKQLTYEDDDIYGMKLHTIRSKVEEEPDMPWDGILPPGLCDWVAREYADINKLANT